MMHKYFSATKYFFGVFFGVGLVVICSPQTVFGATNLVHNGGFETPLVTSSQKWDIFPSGTAGLEWVVGWLPSDPVTYASYTQPTVASLELQETGHLGYLAAEGQQYAELDSDWLGPVGPHMSFPASVKMYQDLQTTPGEQYRLTFSFSPRPDASSTAENKLHIEWGTTSVATLARASVSGIQTEWQPYSYTLVAAASTTRLAFSDEGIPNAVGTYLDDVVVVLLATSTGTSSVATTTVDTTSTSTATTTIPTATTTISVVSENTTTHHHSGGHSSSAVGSTGPAGVVLGASTSPLLCSVSKVPVALNQTVTLTASGGDGTYLFQVPSNFIVSASSGVAISGRFTSSINSGSVIVTSASTVSACPVQRIGGEVLSAASGIIPTAMPNTGTGGNPYVTYTIAYLGALLVSEMLIRRVRTNRKHLAALSLTVKTK